ncbi:hypothetical protein Pse7367_2292 [Thalassoporum mexicanum PCC 7367]|uniref:hypothetical protein n=1 Tax=Thalassoporum mexicanum TaxID=3457544 RepID=UPI00029FAFD9|nr:hypothetical protein [Pseudanabaena sp. PCC 7367]AFY70555.1 hypothetical protein Pse7367_2292 [Pseudanabaena sp. PCC 7367]
MHFNFEILGVSPILDFFNHQQKINQRQLNFGVEYVGTPKCTLDSLIRSIEPVPPKRGWDYEKLVESIVNFWITNPETIDLWRSRLDDAGTESLLVSRVGDIKSLRYELESIFDQ